MVGIKIIKIGNTFNAMIDPECKKCPHYQKCLAGDFETQYQGEWSTFVNTCRNTVECNNIRGIESPKEK